MEGGSRRTREIDQVVELSNGSSLGHRAYFPTFVTARTVNMGNAVLFRFPVCGVANHRLPGRGEPRFVSEAEVIAPGGAIHVFVTHLSLEKKYAHHRFTLSQSCFVIERTPWFSLGTSTYRRKPSSIYWQRVT